MCRSVLKTSFLPTPPLHRIRWGQFTTRKVFAKKKKKNIKYPELYRSHVFQHFTPIGVGSIFIVKNCLKYPDLYKKVKFTSPNTSWAGRGALSILKETIIDRNGLKYPDLHRKIMFGNLLIGKGWGHFTYIFVFDVALFCALDPSLLQPFVVIWGIRKHEFHAVHYISCSFDQKPVFSHMTHYPFP